jgi:hypothetical protein
LVKDPVDEQSKAAAAVLAVAFRPVKPPVVYVSSLNPKTV